MTIIGRIEEANFLDDLAEKVRKATSRLHQVGPRPLLSGTPLGHPVHPIAATGAAGFFVSAVALDWTTRRGRRWASRRLIACGLLAAGPAVITGWSDWMDTADAERRVGLVHATTNSLGIGLMTVSLVERLIGRPGRCSALCGAAAFSVGGWLGGHLAYSMGVGVDVNAFETGPAEWTAVDHAPDRDHPVVRAEVDGVRLVLVWMNETIYALADRCSHRGGPLSEGELTEDGCIRCPWHGSEFAVETGAVRGGPATMPQPSYEVRREGSSLEVRRSEPRALRNNTVRTH